jgi:hypothetical protein
MFNSRYGSLTSLRGPAIGVLKQKMGFERRGSPDGLPFFMPLDRPAVPLLQGSGSFGGPPRAYCASTGTQVLTRNFELGDGFISIHELAQPTRGG